MFTVVIGYPRNYQIRVIKLIRGSKIFKEISKNLIFEITWYYSQFESTWILLDMNIIDIIITFYCYLSKFKSSVAATNYSQISFWRMFRSKVLLFILIIKNDLLLDILFIYMTLHTLFFRQSLEVRYLAIKNIVVIKW